MRFRAESLGAHITLQKGLSYKGEYLSDESELGLVGLDSFVAGGGYKSESEKPYSGPFKEEHLAQPGDVLLAMTEQQDGLLASPLVVPEDLGGFESLIFSHHVAKVVATSECLRPEFLYNFLRVPLNRVRAAYGNTGTTVQDLPYDVIYEQMIPVPSVEEQDRINSFIAVVDRKIELNAAIAVNLERIAQSIFRSWFIDFDPVKAKMVGEKPVGMDDATAALFPDSMKDSELGPIPSGWTVDVLGSYLTVCKGKSYKSSELVDSDTALVTLKSFQRGGGYRPDGLKPFSGKYKPEQVIEAGELIVSYTDVTQAADVIGKPALVLSDPKFSKLVASLDVGIVRPKSKEIGKTYLYQLFLTFRFKHHIDGYTNGTTVLHLGKGALEEFKAVLPGKVLMSKYENLVETFSKQAQVLFLENINLSLIRDSLLPGLISGELQIPEDIVAS